MTRFTRKIPFRLVALKLCIMVANCLNTYW
jgi:hypothetical protein